MDIISEIESLERGPLSEVAKRECSDSLGKGGRIGAKVRALFGDDSEC
jgi:hypothetical protein